MTHLVLIVDDDKHWRALLAEHLQENGLSVLEAADSNEAIQRVEDAAPHLVLLDWRLPDQDGIEALKRIRQLRTDAMVIMLTAFASSNLAVQSIKEGAFDFVQKSANMDEILVTVRRALETVVQQTACARLSAERYRGLILGNSEQIRLLHQQIREAARTIQVLWPKSLAR